MKILITVEFYYTPGGGGIDTQARQIAEHLVKLGHDVTVATSSQLDRPQNINGVKVRGFSVTGNSVKGYRGETKRYLQFLRESNQDVMLNFAANIWTTDLAFEQAWQIRGKKVMSTPGLSKINDPIYKNYYEKVYVKVLRKYDRIVYTSANYRDKFFGDKHGLGSKAVVIPNGAGEEFLAEPLNFRKKYGIRTKFMALTVAHHFWAKGHGFVHEAFGKMKRKDATLVIIGDHPPRHSWYSCEMLCRLRAVINPNFILLTDVPREMVVSAFQEANLFLFGSRLECAPLVMYESFATQTPFVTTEVGNVRDHFPYLEMVRTPGEMAERANDILDSPARTKNLTDRAFELWQNGYTWGKIAGRYDAVFKKMI